MKKTAAKVLTFTIVGLMMICTLLLSGCSNAETTSTETQEVQSTVPETAEAKTPDTVDLNRQTLMVYCGAGMQKPFQEIADAFQADTGCEMNVTFANAAQIQAQISEAQKGAFFIAGSEEEVKPVSDYVLDSEKLVKHIPVLAVASGNPKKITGIADLGNKEIVTVIGDPEATPIGKIAMKAFEDFGVKDTVNLAATTTTAPQLATVIALGEADAAIIWKENCDTDGVEICETKDMDQYIKTIPAARLRFDGESEAAAVFSNFLKGSKAEAIWEKYGYELVK